MTLEWIYEFKNAKKLAEYVAGRKDRETLYQLREEAHKRTSIWIRDYLLLKGYDTIYGIYKARKLIREAGKILSKDLLHRLLFTPYISWKSPSYQGTWVLFSILRELGLVKEYPPELVLKDMRAKWEEMSTKEREETTKEDFIAEAEIPKTLLSIREDVPAMRKTKKYYRVTPGKEYAVEWVNPRRYSHPEQAVGSQQYKVLKEHAKKEGRSVAEKVEEELRERTKEG